MLSTFEQPGPDTLALLTNSKQSYLFLSCSQENSLEVPSGITELVSGPLVTKDEVCYVKVCGSVLFLFFLFSFCNMYDLTRRRFFLL